jgi:hypothetical protein
MDKVAAHLSHRGVHMALTETNWEELIPHSTASEITWHALYPRNLDDDARMLSALGEFGIRSPGAPTEKSKVEPRRRGHVVICEAMPRQGC